MELYQLLVFIVLFMLLYFFILRHFIKGIRDAKKSQKQYSATSKYEIYYLSYFAGYSLGRLFRQNNGRK